MQILATWLFPCLNTTCLQRKSLESSGAVQSETHKLLEQGQVNACISSESEAMPGCKAYFMGRCIIEWSQHLLLCIPGLNKAFTGNHCVRHLLIYNDQDHLHSHLLLAQFGLNQQCFPFHYIPPRPPLRMPFFRIGIRFGSGLSNCGPDSKWDTDRILPECNCDVPLYWHHWKQQSPALKQLTKVILEQAEQCMNSPIQ